MGFASIKPMSLALPSSPDRQPLPAWRRLRLATPAAAYRLAGRVLPWCWLAALMFAAAGLVVGLLIAPSDVSRGEAYRIAFVHYPAAWMSVLIYLAMVAWALAALRMDVRLASMMARALAPTGALMAFVALWTGSLWGKPSWGVWWVWEPRLGAEMALFVQFVAIMLLQASIDDPRRSDRAGALLALAGLLHLPLIYFAVAWWQVRHPGVPVEPMVTPARAGAVLAGTLLMAAAFCAWALAAALHRVRSIILECEQGGEWLSSLPEARR